MCFNVILALCMVCCIPRGRCPVVKGHIGINCKGVYRNKLLYSIGYSSTSNAVQIMTLGWPFFSEKVKFDPLGVYTCHM